MSAPWLDVPPGILAVPIGVAFGVTLERAGLGSARTIANQLRARDFTVLKVMFAAIVTAMLGIFWADRLGWLDLSRVTMPTTDILPQLIGAVLFGAGFAVASLCPGTACVSAATGKGDGLATIGGLSVGTLLVALFWTQLGAVAERAPHIDATLPADLGIAPGMVVALITAAAVIAIWWSGRIEQGSGGAPTTSRTRVSPLAATAITLGALAAVTGKAPLASSRDLQRIGSVIDSETDHIDAVALAEWVRDRKPGLRVIDVRDGLAPDDYRIPGAEDVPVSAIPALRVRPGEIVVLYSDGGGHAAQAWMLLRLRGIDHAFVLRDGLQAWEDDVLAPRKPDSTDAAAMTRYRHAHELSQWFGGLPASGSFREAPDSSVASSGRTVRRRKSC